jgi:outer membrane usher protein
MVARLHIRFNLRLSLPQFMVRVMLSRTFFAPVCLLLSSTVVWAQSSTDNATKTVSTTSQTPESKTGDKFLSLEVLVNGVNGGVWPILERASTLYAPKMAFAEWRLIPQSKAVPIQVRGQTYLALSSVPGFQWNINYAAQTLEVQFAPTAFSATLLTDDAAKRVATSPALLGAFVNYDISATHSKYASTTNSNDIGAVVEFGVTNSLGVLTNTYVGKNIFNTATGTNDKGWRRLETTYTRDLPEYNQTLRLGDTMTSRGMWGREVYFAGVQWGSNDALSPGLNTRALPIVSGISSAPSTVELYVNDALRQTSKVPTGPFTIDNFPMVTGAGEARIVIKDILGRETVMVQPFLTHQSLIAPGRNEWSVEAGLPRYNIGIENADYGKPLASGFWRHGWSTSVSSEFKLEASRERSATGLGLAVGLPGQHIGAFAAVASQDKVVGSGQQLIGELSRISDNWTYSLRALRSSGNFRTLGQTTPLNQQISLSSNFRVGDYGNLGVALVSTSVPDQTRQTSLNLSHSQKIGRAASLVTTLTKVQGGVSTITPNTGSSSSSVAIGFSLSVPFDDGVNVNASVTSKPGASSGFVSATEPLRGEVGSSWRVLAGQRESETYAEAGYYYQGTAGMVTADLQASSNQQVLRLGAQGGLVAAEGHVFARPRGAQSYALTEVKGYSDVGVMVNGRPLGVTDAAGISLVAGLSPYQANAIRLNPQDLPISAELDSIEVSVNPPWRSIVKANFPVRTGRAALLKIVFDDGQPAPAAAVVQIKDDAQVFYVARRGEAYVTGLAPSNILTLNWKEQSCPLTVDLPPENRDTILRLGPLVCKGVQR